MKELEKYALVAEIVGAVAIVISLFYVGYQLRLNTDENRASSIQSINAGYRDLALVYVNNKEAGIAWHKMLDGEQLSKREVDLMTDKIFSDLMLLEETYFRANEGYLDKEFLESKISLMQEKVLISDQVRAGYDGMKKSRIFTQSFINWFDGELRNSKLF